MQTHIFVDFQHDLRSSFASCFQSFWAGNRFFGKEKREKVEWKCARLNELTSARKNYASFLLKFFFEISNNFYRF